MNVLVPTVDRQSLLMERYGFQGITQRSYRFREVTQVDAFTPARILIIGCTVNGERLVVVTDGAPVIFETRIGETQTAEIASRIRRLADFAVDGNGMLQPGDRLPKLTQIQVRHSQLVQMGGFRV